MRSVILDPPATRVDRRQGVGASQRETVAEVAERQQSASRDALQPTRLNAGRVRLRQEARGGPVVTASFRRCGRACRPA
jgi:hypothetical protein